MDKENKKNIFGLKPQYLKMIVDLFSKNEKIKKAIIYGSRAKGNFQDGSDIDISIVAPELDLSGYLKLIDQLESLDIPNKIDLTKFEFLEGPIIDHIKRVGIEIYKRKEN